ncbi:MAG: TGS domain-containing protein, partial [Bacteroidales bacterium]|nr:TGS domain-containing protein [Bacteroidales bacterium]
MITITFPDGKQRQYEAGTTGYQIAESISPRLVSEVLAVSVNDKTMDLQIPIRENATVKFYKWEDEQGKQVFWHSSSHLMAEALEILYPGVKFGIGPAIENGFYYDVDLGGRALVEADLAAIEQKMLEMARSKQPFVRREVSKEQAMKTYLDKGDPYKCELIGDLEDGTISFYTNGSFTDLCRGPHIPDTSVV